MPEMLERFSWNRLKNEPELREEFLQESQPFIRHVVNQICRRTLDWGRDEELSEGLIAFNDAISHYEPDRGVPFLAYAKLLIKRRLIDYFRRETVREAVPMGNEEFERAVDVLMSLCDHEEKKQNQERALEIQLFNQELQRFGLTFKDLVAVSPKHRDTRENLLYAARELALDPDLWSQVEKNGRIPMKALAEKTGLHPKVLERGRKYILAVGLLIAHRQEYVYLREYVLPAERRDGNG